MKNHSHVRAYVTELWMTKGILEMEGSIGKDGWFVSSTNIPFRIAVGPEDFSLNLADAQTQVLRKAISRLRSIAKQMARIEKVIDKRGAVRVDKVS